MADSDRQQRTQLVTSIHKAVEKTGALVSAHLVHDARILDDSIKIDAKSADTNSGSLRVTCATHSVATAEIDSRIDAHCVEFFVSRPRNDNVIETRLLGIAKYPDSDGRWRVPFVTERFARRADDALVIHAEVLDGSGRMLGANLIAPVM